MAIHTRGGDLSPSDPRGGRGGPPVSPARRAVPGAPKRTLPLSGAKRGRCPITLSGLALDLSCELPRGPRR